MKRTIFLWLFNFIILSLSAQEPIRIFVSYSQPFIEIEDYVSAEDLRGATLAMERANERGGVLGRPVEIINGRVPNITAGKELSVALLQSQQDFSAVMGANISNLSMLIAPLFQEAGIPMVSPISTHPDLTAMGDYIFRACFTDSFQGRVMASFALNELSARTAVVLTKSTSTFSISLSEFFIESFENQGEVLAQEYYLTEESDYSSMMERVRALDPDVVFVPGHGSDAGMILRQAHNMGLDQIFLGGDGWGKGVLGVASAEAAEGHYFVNHWHSEIDTPQNREFVERYRARYGDGPIAGSAALAYDAFNLILYAMELCGSDDPQCLRDSIASMDNYQGITGVLSFDAQGDPIDKSAVILTYRDGEIHFVESIVP